MIRKKTSGWRSFNILHLFSCMMRHFVRGCLSCEWEERQRAVSSAPHQPLINDYQGPDVGPLVPPAVKQLHWLCSDTGRHQHTHTHAQRGRSLTVGEGLLLKPWLVSTPSPPSNPPTHTHTSGKGKKMDANDTHKRVPTHVCPRQPRALSLPCCVATVICGWQDPNNSRNNARLFGWLLHQRSLCYAATLSQSVCTYPPTLYCAGLCFFSFFCPFTCFYNNN